MTWVAWRVQRDQYLVAGAAVAAVLAFLAISGLDPYSSWATGSAHGLAVLLSFLPGALGLALGASLVGSEEESGTNRLAWTQSVSRRAWLGRKVVLGATVTGALAAVSSALGAWWATTGFGQGPTMMPKVFGISGAVVVAYGLFAFALGVLLGAAVGRAGWAFALGAPVVVAVRLWVDASRNALVAPTTLVNPPSLAYQQHGWPLNLAYLPIGRTSPAAGLTWAQAWTMPRSRLVVGCVQHGPTSQYFARSLRCSRAAHLQLVVQYQPDRHYWALQGAESAIFAALALVATAAAFVVVARRRH